MFTVVQTKKTVRSKPSMSSVPSGWIVNGQLFWPPRNQTTLITDPQSKADTKTWKMMDCKIIGKPTTLSNAEKSMDKLKDVTDSDDALLLSRGTRNSKPERKPKFVSKSYQLKAQDDRTVSFGHFFYYLITLAYMRMCFFGGIL